MNMNIKRLPATKPTGLPEKEVTDQQIVDAKMWVL